MPKDLSSIRLGRLNRIMMELALGDVVPKERLLCRLEYARGRTFERDLRFLRDEYAVDVAYDRRRKGYQLRGSGRFLLTLDLSDREVTALAAGLRMAAHFLPHLDEECARLWHVLRSVIPESLGRQGDTLGKCAVVALPVSPVAPDIFEIVTGAITRRRMLRFAYASPQRSDGEAREHTVSPWGVYFRAHAWYLCGQSERHGTPGNYRVGRIIWAEMLDCPWHADVPEGMCMEDYASSAWYGRPGPATIPVRIRVRAPLTTAVSETVWHPTQRIVWETGESLVLEATVPDLEDVAHWVLASAPHATALDPPELRRLVTAWAGMVEKGNAD